MGSYVLLAAVPAAACLALACFGRLVEMPGGAPGLVGARIRAVCASLVLLLVLVAALAR